MGLDSLVALLSAHAHTCVHAALSARPLSFNPGRFARASLPHNRQMDWEMLQQIRDGELVRGDQFPNSGLLQPPGTI